MSIAWSTESLVTLLSSSAPDDERTVLRLLDRVSELTAAQGFGVVTGHDISYRSGLLQADIVDARLVRAIRQGAGVVELADGHIVALHALLVDPVTTRFLVFVRTQPFERAETDLLDTLAQLVSVLFRQQRSLDVEQSAREATEALAAADRPSGGQPPRPPAALRPAGVGRAGHLSSARRRSRCSTPSPPESPS